MLANDIDADGDELEAKLSKGPDHGHLDLNHDGGFDYEPDHGFTGIDTFTYLAHDGTIGVGALVTITVTNVAPIGRNDHYTTKEGVKIQVDRPGVLKNDDDADGDDLKAKLVGGPDHGKLDLHDEGEFDYEPAHGFSGTDVFTYRAVDGADQSAVIRVVIDVEPKATPQPTPAPTPTPSPQRRRRDPTPKPTPKPDKTDDPKPDRTREPRPTDSPDAGGGSGGNGGGSGGNGGQGRQGRRRAGRTGAASTAPGDGLDRTARGRRGRPDRPRPRGIGHDDRKHGGVRRRDGGRLRRVRLAGAGPRAVGARPDRGRRGLPPGHRRSRLAAADPAPARRGDGLTGSDRRP